MHDVAESRLRSVTKHLLKENIFKAYDDVLRQWQRDGIIGTTLEDEISNPVHYLSHRILCGSAEKATLQIFTDASTYGYACYAFLRCEEEEEVKVSLVLAKARVAPVKKPTIPRLELLGAAIGVRIASTILEALKFPLKTYFWTDSMIVLGWITNTESWNTFVDPEDFVRPTVLPDNPIVRRLIYYAHKTLHHAGVQTILSHQRQQFWIPQDRRVVKEVFQKCATCRRYTSKPVVPVVPAPLPIDRINHVAAFEVTGADLAGPIYLKGGEKAWIVIFTCAVYRTIHLELVNSLSTEAFMQAMQRFFARRGRSSIMYTNNGTNFLGTSRALSNLNWQEIIAECAIQKIKWHFNPAAAPWYGGWWERMICIIKQLLRKVLGLSTKLLLRNELN
ncbi:hypothetical protein AVEN_75543-1 [Araneus ventricosus]|uniref:Integrase catalytic domain-containing protein n=1 Tax=Araneus ventricosus TaxID=182803 RepID=A0A4Y2DQS4_ARAVE|nr:hypothetical protein AVEN_75543-1 [Araneus ventricosus]